MSVYTAQRGPSSGLPGAPSQRSSSPDGLGLGSSRKQLSSSDVSERENDDPFLRSARKLRDINSTYVISACKTPGDAPLTPNPAGRLTLQRRVTRNKESSLLGSEVGESSERKTETRLKLQRCVRAGSVDRRTPAGADSVDRRTPAGADSVDRRTPARADSVDRQTTARADSMDRRATARADSVDRQTTARADSVDRRTPARADSMDRRTPARADSVDRRTPARADSIDRRTPAEADSVDRRTTAGADSVDRRTTARADSIDRRTPAGADSVDRRTPAGADSVDRRTPAGADSVDRWTTARADSTTQTVGGAAVNDGASRDTSRKVRIVSNEKNSPVASSAPSPEDSDTGLVADEKDRGTFSALRGANGSVTREYFSHSTPIRPRKEAEEARPGRLATKPFQSPLDVRASGTGSWHHRNLGEDVAKNRNEFESLGKGTPVKRTAGHTWTPWHGTPQPQSAAMSTLRPRAPSSQGQQKPKRSLFANKREGSHEHTLPPTEAAVAQSASTERDPLKVENSQVTVAVRVRPFSKR